MKKKNIKSLEFHIKSNDYFGTLATILSLVRQNIEKNKYKKLNIKTLNETEKDLLYLQNNYKIMRNITQKTKSEKEQSESKNIQSILKKANLSPEENKEFEEAIDEMVNGINNAVVKENK